MSAEQLAVHRGRLRQRCERAVSGANVNESEWVMVSALAINALPQLVDALEAAEAKVKLDESEIEFHAACARALQELCNKFREKCGDLEQRAEIAEAKVARLEAMLAAGRRLYDMVLWLQRSGWDNAQCRDEVAEAMGDMATALGEVTGG